MKKSTDKQGFEKILHNAKLKNTASRLAVLEMLSEIKYPATVEDLYKSLGKNKVDLVTLYRTLASFEKRGILRRVDLRKDAVYYELNTDHHHHIVCTNCDKIEDFENSEIEKVLGKIAKKSINFIDIKNHSLELFGLCRECV